MGRELSTGNRVSTLKERDAEFHPTHYGALAVLLTAERRRLPKRLWEPACGNGALVVPLRNRGFEVMATDLHDWGCQEPYASGLDFTSWRRDVWSLADDVGIVTNPPFSMAQTFIDRATSLSPYVAIFARLAFFESDRRFGWFQERRLYRVHVISDRLPMMHRFGWDGPKLDKSGMAFAWFIFEQRRPRRSHAKVYWHRWQDAVKKEPWRAEDEPPVAEDRRKK